MSDRSDLRPDHTSDELRRRAERLATLSSGQVAELSKEDVRDLVYELQVHQIELELQNEELQRAYLELEEVSRRYRDLYRFAPVGLLTLDEEQTIRECNLAVPSMLRLDRAEVIGAHLAKFLFDQTAADALHLHIIRARDSRTVQTCELRFRLPADSHLWTSVVILPLQHECSGGAHLLALSDIGAQKLNEQQLESWNRALEDRVRERTEELERTIAELQDEVARRVRAEENLRDRSERLSELNLALEKRTAQMQELTLQLSETEDRERRRLAEVLHDDLQQILVGARLQLSSLIKHTPPRRERQKAEDVQSLLDRAVELSRSLSHELSPLTLDESGLVPALRRLGELMRKSHGLDVSVEAPPGVEPGDAATSSMLYRAVRELLNNVSKHSGSGRAEVRLRRQDAWIEVIVEDFGCGIDPSRLEDGCTISEGFGLRSIRERVEILGGRLQITSRPGQGTRVHLFVPL
ncbi:MAG: ATP-binding protein [Acidobacteriota bacterium]